MIETYIRPLYQSLAVDFFAGKLARYFSANQITALACLIGTGVMPALMLGSSRLATALILISGYLDTLDGTIARLSEKNSPKGAVLDITSDRIVEFSIILGLYAVDPLHRGWPTLLMLGSCFICVTSFLVVGIFTPNHSTKGFHYSIGLIERPEAFIFFLAMIWLPKYFLALSTIFTILVFLTSYLRIKQFMHHF